MTDTTIIAGTIARKHKWDHENEKRLAACEFEDGNARTEKVCRNCGMTKITVHYPEGFPTREWRTAAGELWWGDATPPCGERSA